MKPLNLQVNMETEIEKQQEYIKRIEDTLEKLKKLTDRINEITSLIDGEN